ncbi:Transcription initiation factor TFIID subunit 7 [Operophtera brumata]|uniref:Transcription initiation factor TFIID subunit 7 n=1 Tax=Operophtera brumata TaxID=104452 RepID=A0A0L7KVQ3_OPEBR|nr:Transcription initiation factor TFIID subunit 7 [Operophtera brumata]
MIMPRDKKDIDYPVELETQFILRMPEEPAKSLREVLRLGENFKNRLSIQMENDMRHGEVRFDDWLLHAKKSVEAPEIEKEVKRLLRADNEAVSITWEIIDEAVKEEEPSAKPEQSASVKPEKVKTKKEHIKAEGAKQSSSKVEDIFGGTLSDSDLEDENINVDIEDSRLSTYEDTYSETSMQATDFSKKSFATEFSSDMFNYPSTSVIKTPEAGSTKGRKKQPKPSTSTADPYAHGDYSHAAEVDFKLQQLTLQLEELKQRKQKTQQEIHGLENMTLRQRFQEILQAINKDIAFKEIEYQRLMGHK